VSYKKGVQAGKEESVVNIRIRLVRRNGRRKESDLERRFARVMRKDRKTAERFARKCLAGSWACSASGMVRGYNREILNNQPPFVYLMDLEENQDRLLALRDVLEGKLEETMSIPFLHAKDYHRLPEDCPNLRSAYVTSYGKRLMLVFYLKPAT
jgi:hypothetical protein